MNPLFPDIRERIEKATPGKSWINLLQSNGCEVCLFDQTYTIWLSAKKPETILSGNFKQTERDAEFITHSPTDIARLLKAVDLAVEALEKHHCHNDNLWDVQDGYPCELCETLVRLKELSEKK